MCDFKYMSAKRLVFHFLDLVHIEFQEDEASKMPARSWIASLMEMPKLQARYGTLGPWESLRVGRWLLGFHVPLFSSS